MPIIDAGKDFREFLKGQGKPSDQLSVRRSYREAGLEKRLGAWRGTGQQYRALLTLGTVEQRLEGIRRKTAALKTMISEGASLKAAGIRFGGADIAPDIAPTKEFAKEFPELGKAQEGALRIGPESGKPERLSPLEGVGFEAVPEELLEKKEENEKKLKVETTEEEIPTGKPPISPDDVKLDSTDIGDIITEIETGEFATPETVTAEAGAELLKEGEKSRAISALETIQQNLAAQGMAFSGIRTKSESGLAAQSLMRLSGISLNLAERIIDAARTEQRRREQVIQLQKDAQTAALKSMGYVINPFTGKMEKTVERERLEEPTRFSSGGSVYEYDPQTGVVKTLIEGVGDIPTSYEEWELAGGKEGTGISYAQYLMDRGETQTERDRALKIAAFAQARPELDKSKGDDGYVNPETYMRLRGDYADVIGDADEFDDLFSPMLSPKERIRLGVGKVGL